MSETEQGQTDQDAGTYVGSNAPTRELTITRLGAHGDGVADLPGGAFYVPFALAGERVRASGSGAQLSLTEVLEPSVDRVTPLCRHFTVCGGCVTQHLARGAEQAWKVTLVKTAFSQHRIEAPLLPLVSVEPGTRRRAVFAARRTGTGVVFGFHEAQTHTIVDLAECPILAPEIASRIGALRALAGVLLSRSGEARFTVTQADNGIDVAAVDTKPVLSLDDRAAISKLAGVAQIIKLSIGGESVFSSKTPMLTFGTAKVAMPPGVFLQAVPSAEAAMAEIVRAACGKAKRVADLFSGIGTFSFVLAKSAEVLAVDNDKTAIAALVDAAKRTQGIKPFTAKARDLFQDPLSVTELKAFDAVVFDPPRAGADAQAQRIAKSQVPTVVAVSCAPGSLARDCKTLIEGGYTLESVTPIDQFVFSPHVEAIAVLRRAKAKR